MFQKLIYLTCLFLLLSLTVHNASAELIGWWKFDGDFVDSSGNDNIATPVGSPTFVGGMLNQAINLNAVNTEDYINCGPNMGFATIGDGGEADGFSIAAWVNRTVAGDDQKICSNLSVSSWAEGAGFQFAIYRNRTELDMRDSTGRFFSRDVDSTGFTQLEINRWYHIVFVFDDVANTLTEYIDGEKTHTIENIPTSLAASTHDFYIGSQSPSFNASRVFRGMIDDFRLYSNAVTEDEVQTIMQGGFVAFPQAADPIPEDKAVLREVSATLSWTPGDFAVTHDVYFGDSFDDVNEGTGDTFKSNQTETTYTVDGLELGTTYYWRIDERNDDKPDSPWKGEIWSFVVAPRTAFDPNPINGAFFVDTNSVLSWEPGFDAQTHTVYFGDDPDVVANTTGGTEQTEASFNPGQLENRKFYYWRVDEFDGNDTYTGQLWSFKTAKEGGGIRGNYYNDSEFNNLVLTRIDPQINFSWAEGEFPDESISSNLYSIRWTGIVEAAFTEPYTFYTTTLGGVRLWVDDQLIIDHWSPHTAFLDAGKINLEAGNSYSIAMDFYHIERDSIAELRWESPRTPTEFVPQAALSVPVKALKPTPGNNAVNVDPTPTLTWAPGEIAVSHELYFGIDREAVRNADKNSAEYIGPRALGEESYEPGELEWLTTYYWRVDEINNDGSIETGSVWSFTTADFLLVDDFEAYNDINPGEEGSNRIFYTWSDGYDNPSVNGSTIGYPDPSIADGEHFVETEIVHSGNQSAPFLYDNTTANYSEVTVNPDNLTIGTDWTRDDVKVMTLWFYGDPNNPLTEQLYVTLNNVKVLYNGNPDDIAKPQWSQWNIDLSAFGIDLTNVTQLGIGMDKTGATGGSGILFLDDIRLYRVAP